MQSDPSRSKILGSDPSEQLGGWDRPLLKQPCGSDILEQRAGVRPLSEQCQGGGAGPP